MPKKVCLVLLMLIFFQQAFAMETAVKVTPAIKYSTSKATPKEGDYIEFKTIEDIGQIKAGTKVTGLLTERKENGFSKKTGSLYIEQFKMNGKNLDGIVYQKGNEHPVYFEYFDWLFSLPIRIFSPENSFVRGGEAFLKPNVDIFTLYLRE